MHDAIGDGFYTRQCADALCSACFICRPLSTDSPRQLSALVFAVMRWIMDMVMLIWMQSTMMKKRNHAAAIQ